MAKSNGPVNNSDLLTLLERSGDANKGTFESEVTSQSYIIETIPENNKSKNDSGFFPVVNAIIDSPPKKSPITQVVVDDEDHNTLDFGKYVFVDPSTGDIQVMRKSFQKS